MKVVFEYLKFQDPKIGILVRALSVTPLPLLSRAKRVWNVGGGGCYLEHEIVSVQLLCTAVCLHCT